MIWPLLRRARADRVPLTVPALLLAVALALAGCGGGHRSAGSAGSVSRDWPVWGGDAENTHFTPLTQVGATNVGRLHLVWQRAEGPGLSGWETFPVVVGTTMYYSTNTDEVVAVSATTGRVRWTFTPPVNFLADPHVFAVQPVNRGVTVAHGRVYEVTADDQLIALDAATGGRLWDVRVTDPVSGAALNSAGVYWKGEIILGGPAGAAGQRGFLAAYDAVTGAPRWRTYVVPRRGRGWMAHSSVNGGGDVWMSPVVDPRTGTVYAATGNPSPAFTTDTRRGCDRWTDATVALDARTGRLKWGYSALCGDAWDYDSDQSPVLVDLKRGGASVPAVADASKAGFIYVLDARTGQRIARSPSLVHYSQPHRVPTTGGVVVCPGIFGGIEYGPSAYDPGTGSLYVGATNACMRYRATASAGEIRRADGADELNGTTDPLPGERGTVTALSPGTGRVRWRTHLPGPVRGGVLASAGGLIFVGCDDGYLYGLGARSGRVLWRFRTGLRFGSAPLAYEIDGREYIAVAAGGSSATKPTADHLAREGGELEVLALRSIAGQ